MTSSPERRAAEVFLSELYLLLLARPDVAGRMVMRGIALTVTACARAGSSRQRRRRSGAGVPSG